MKLKTTDSFELRKYLLGFHLPNVEKNEERLLADDAFFTELLIEEEELIQDYVDGHLSVSENVAFENHFLITKERKESVQFARLMSNQFGNKSESNFIADATNYSDDFGRKSFFVFGKGNIFGGRNLLAGATALIIVLFLGLFFFSSNVRQASPLETEFAELNGQDFNDLRRFEDFTQINLIAGVTRGSNDTDQISLGRITQKTVFRLGILSNAQSVETFRIELSKNNEVIFIQRQIKAITNKNGGEVRFLLPSTVIEKGRYRIVATSNQRQSSRFHYTFSVK